MRLEYQSCMILSEFETKYSKMISQYLFSSRIILHEGIHVEKEDTYCFTLFK